MQTLAEIFEKYYHGSPGEKALFTRPFRTKYQAHDETADLLLKLYNAGDDRSLVLVAALVSEKYVERLLHILLPGYDPEREFRRKINLLQSFSIIPSHLVAAAGLVNSVRNKFAHQLEISTFLDLETAHPKLIDQMKGLCIANNIPVKDEPFQGRILFDDVCQMATMGIRRYEANVKFYSEFIRTQHFIEFISREHDTEVSMFNAMVIEALRAHQGRPFRDDEAS